MYKQIFVKANFEVNILRKAVFFFRFATLGLQKYVVRGGF